MHHDTRVKFILDLGLPPVQLAVMLAINRFANHKHHRCWPSIATISRLAVVHRATTIRAIQALEKAGHIELDSGHDLRTVSTYTVVPRMFTSRSVRLSTGRRMRQRTNYHVSLCKRCGVNPAEAPYGPLCWTCADVPDNVVPINPHKAGA